jgi:hypothetical protein
VPPSRRRSSNYQAPSPMVRGWGRREVLIDDTVKKAPAVTVCKPDLLKIQTRWRGVYWLQLLRPGTRCGCYLKPTIPAEAEVCGKPAFLSCGSAADQARQHTTVFCQRHWNERMAAVYDVPPAAVIRRLTRQLKPGRKQ